MIGHWVSLGEPVYIMGEAPVPYRDWDGRTEARHARDKCMNCEKPPIVDVLWANGKGHAWFCAKCYDVWKKEGHEVDYEKEIEHGIARMKFSDRNSPKSLRECAVKDVPGKGADLPDEEILSLNLRLQQLWKLHFQGNEREKVKGKGDLTRAQVIAGAKTIRREMKKRGLELDEDVPLYRDLEEVDTIVVKNFVSIVGSVAKGDPEADDVDVLIRADRVDGQGGPGFFIRAEDVEIPIRKLFDKSLGLHWVANPQGAHDDYKPLADLVLRTSVGAAKQVVEAAAVTTSGVRIDLGCGENKPEGYIGVDKRQLEGVDLVHDLDMGLPFPDDYAQHIRANHFLEHVRDPVFIMNEIYRVLVPRGTLAFDYLSTEGKGAFADPTHVSYWNRLTLYFFTQDALREAIGFKGKFEEVKVEQVEEDGKVYVRGILRVVPVELEELEPPKETTRVGTAEDWWEKNWASAVSVGEGRFIFHGHFPSLTEEESEEGLLKLLAGNKQYHSDLRLEGKGGLWGFTVFEGKSGKVGKTGTRMTDLKPNRPMRGTFKQQQPEGWLDVAKREPVVTEEIGRVGKERAKLFALDYGTYKLTYGREHAFELLLTGKKNVVTGRYMIVYVPTGGGMWMLTKPAEQDTTFPQQNKLERVIKDMRGQKWLFWRASPDEPLEKIDVTKFKEGGK